MQAHYISQTGHSTDQMVNALVSPVRSLLCSNTKGRRVGMTMHVLVNVATPVLSRSVGTQLNIVTTLSPDTVSNAKHVIIDKYPKLF